MMTSSFPSGWLVVCRFLHLVRFIFPLCCFAGSFVTFLTNSAHFFAAEHPELFGLGRDMMTSSFPSGWLVVCRFLHLVRFIFPLCCFAGSFVTFLTNSAHFFAAEHPELFGLGRDMMTSSFPSPVSQSVIHASIHSFIHAFIHACILSGRANERTNERKNERTNERTN